MTTGPIPDANRLFDPWQVDIFGWETFQKEVNHLNTTYPDVPFVWRGQSDARWGLQSSLHRTVSIVLERPATEDDLIRAEKNLLLMARIEWRMDGVKSLQLLAQLQHVGAPTRLIDVTMNPLIAAWFAVSQNELTDARAGRLFAFADTQQPLQLNSQWDTNTPRWHQLKSDAVRRNNNWGTGRGRRVWRPPAIHARIPAQNAAFILDGVPIDDMDLGNRMPWSAAELREFASVPMRLAHAHKGRLPRSFSPVFTYRVTPDAKLEIREQLENRFGYRFSTVYADLEGLKEYALRWPTKALGLP